MKHSDILEKLDPLQKVALVTSGLEDSALALAGVAPSGKTMLSELAKAHGVPYASAACAWDADGINGMTKELVAEAGAEGARLFIMPDLKTAAVPNREALCEDAYLNGVLGAALAKGTHAAGGAVGLSRLSVNAEDIQYLDKREDAAAIHELVAAPFLQATRQEPCEAVLLTPNRVGSGYPDTNRILFRDALHGYYGDLFLIGEDTAPISDSISLLQGRVSLGGAKLPIERAVKRYSQLARYQQEGSISARSLEESVREGSAIDGHALDETADEVLTFCEDLSSRTIAEPCGDEMRRRMAEECIVLLKNEKVLPLAQGTKLAVLGAAYEDLSALEARFTVTGQAEGYERGTERSDALIPEAVRIAGGADAVLLFLYPDGEGHSLELPANRIALLSAVAKTGKPVIALICGERPVDLSFDGEAAAVLTVPSDGPFAGEALARVLSGEVSPCGKLVRTYYDNAEAYFAALRRERGEDRIRIGSFVGYLRYDTADEAVRYPFGFGLSYTAFSYFGLEVGENGVTFTVKNTGSRDGAEIAQVYLGAPSSSRIMPEKKLVGFAKVFLRAGESKQVTVALPEERFATFDARTLTDTVEAGVYKIYVCASSRDVRLRGKKSMAGTVRAKRKESLSDYFPDTVRTDVSETGKKSRILDEKKLPPKKLGIARSTLYSFMPAIAIVFFLVLTLLILSYTVEYASSLAINRELAEFVLFAVAVFVLAVIPLLSELNRRKIARLRAAAIIICPFVLFGCFLLGYFMLRTDAGELIRIAHITLACLAVGTPLTAFVAWVVERELVRSKSEINGWSKYYFEAGKTETVTTEKQFEDAFLIADAARTAAEGPKQKRAEPESAPAAEVTQFYDKTLTFGVMLRDCRQYLSERGMNAGEETMRSWISALASTQLLIIPSGGSARFAETVAEYFGKKAYIDNAEQFVRTEDLFSHWDNHARMTKSTAFRDALEAAQRESAFLHTVLIRHVNTAYLAPMFEPVADLIARRKTAVSLSGMPEISLPQNLRIVVELETEKIEELPAVIAEVAAVLSPKYIEGEEAEKKSAMQTVGFGHFAMLQKTMRDEYPLSEITWKTVDRLDERCRAAHINNLLWIKLERHASAAAACGAGEREALKDAIDAELYAWMKATWNSDLCGVGADETLAEVLGGAPVAEEAKPRGGRRKKQ